MSKDLCIIYLGRTGGQPPFVKAMVEEIIKQKQIENFNLIISKYNLLKEDTINIKKDTYTLSTPISNKDLLFKFLPFIFNFTKIILKNKNKNYIFTMTHPWNFVCIIIIKIFIKNSNIIDICHAFDYNSRSMRDRIEKLIIKLEYKLSNTIITLSEGVKNDILKYYKNKKILSLYHPLFSSYKENKNTKSLHNKIPTFIIFGRMLEYKGLFLLLNSFQKLSDIKKGNVKLIIAGEGVLSEKENEMIESINKKYNNIELINKYIDEKEIENIWNRSDICCLSYLNSWQSGVVLLSIIKSIPSIITPHEALKTQCYIGTNKEIALCSEEITSESFLEKMLEILDNNIYERLSTNTINIRKELSWENFITGLNTLLKNNTNEVKINQENKKVSVVMSVYNAEKYLRYSIESILNQTYKNIEFIIINDGSTDDSLSIIKDYQKIDNRIILINRENKGLIYSLNEGVRLSTGDYIARMDADDISMENRIEKELNYLENENAYLCGSWVVKINEEGNEIGKYNYPPKTWFKNRIFLLKGNSFIHPTTIFKREILNDKSIYKNGILYRNYKYIEDYELWTRVSNKYKSINISEYLLKYRIHNSQETIKLKSIKIKLHIRFLALWRLIINIF